MGHILSEGYHDAKNTLVHYTLNMYKTAHANARINSPINGISKNYTILGNGFNNKIIKVGPIYAPQN